MARITTSPLFVRRPPLGMLRLRRLMVPPLVVADTAHGAVVGDFVTFSGATSLGGVITAAVLNQEYEITLVVNANSYQIVSRTGGTTLTQQTWVDTSTTPHTIRNVAPVPANGSDTGNGGGSIVGNYQINIGLNTTVRASGWGAGTWGVDQVGAPHLRTRL